MELRGCPETRAILPACRAASEEDWGTEYLAPVLSVRVVSGLDEAMDHIGEHGSRHTDAIVTEDQGRARRFLAEVDSSSVMVNASTRFADGLRVRPRGGDRHQHRQAPRPRPGGARRPDLAEVHRARRRPRQVLRKTREGTSGPGEAHATAVCPRSGRHRNPRRHLRPGALRAPAPRARDARAPGTGFGAPPAGGRAAASGASDRERGSALRDAARGSRGDACARGGPAGAQPARPHLHGGHPGRAAPRAPGGAAVLPDGPRRLPAPRPVGALAGDPGARASRGGRAPGRVAARARADRPTPGAAGRRGPCRAPPPAGRPWCTWPTSACPMSRHRASATVSPGDAAWTAWCRPRSSK